MASVDIPDKQRRVFLENLEKTDHVASSAVVAGLARRTVYAWRDADQEFAEAWDAARERYVDRLEAEARRRAVDGTAKGIWHQGAKVGEEMQYSDSLLAQMLKAKRREYRDKVELGNADDKPLQVEDSPTAAARTIAFALALGLRAKQGQPAIADSGEDMV